ncbi:hypothetical protein AAG906_016058 [Vitis piasezkii]
MIEEKEQEGDAKVGSLQLLNALKAKPMPKMTQSKGLMYVEALVNGKATKALVDIGATHNFVSEEEARRLELQASKERGCSSWVIMHIGSWEGRVDFTVAPMDDFKMEEKPCMVPTVTEGTLKTPMLSAMQVKKGLKREKDGTTELQELRRQLKELLDAGSSNHPRLPMACDLVTVKNKYPIPLIADLFDQLGRARYFTKLDLRSGYYQVRIAEGDEPKTTCVTRYGSYEFLVMPFGLTNAPATNTLKEHKEHLRKVFKILRQNELYVKKEKCSFAKEEVSFLGHHIRDGKLMMDNSKVKAIQEWDPPTKVPQLRSFLGAGVGTTDHTKVFEVHIDASDFAIGGVLMQERHPITFESRKLNDTEERLQRDPVSKSLIALAHEGKTKRFWVEDDLLYTKGRRLYVPKALLELAYYWPQIRDEVEAYVRTCLVCQQDKVEQRQPRGLLEPLPIVERPWDSVTMDFIIGLPKSEDNDSIIVEMTRLFLKHVVKYWGLPKYIISDRDPRFTGKFWTELFKLMGSELHFSTSFHPQTDG